MATSDYFNKPNEPEAFRVQAFLLAEVVKRILKKRAEVDLSSKPVLRTKPITEFMRRMRVNSFDKFEGTTYISTVNFYFNENDMENHKALGAIVLYVPEDYIVKLLQKLNYPITDEEDQDALEDGCGTFCNLIAGNFKSGLLQLGYAELEMSHFSSFRNEILNGVEYHYPYEKEKYEISFEIGGQKSIVAELTLGPVHTF